MGLVNTVDILEHAEKYSYAVGAFNVINLDFLNGILEAAEAMKSPVIINIAQVHFPYVNIEQIAPAVKYMAENACIPVVLNLDHGVTLEAVVRALRCGFSAIMYDASKKPIDQNIEETRLVVKMAHSVGVSVEAELGQVGGAEGEKKAAKAQAYFERTFQKRDPFSAIKAIELTAGSEESPLLINTLCDKDKLNIIESKSEFRRLISQGAITVNDKKVTDLFYRLIRLQEYSIKVGKTRFSKVILR